MKYIDLHTHSTSSDGTYTPTELVELAIQSGLSALALTDHDTVTGIPEAIQAAEDSSLEVIPGIELSTRYGERDIHILGLCIDYTDTAFLAQLTKFMDSRLLRNEKIYELLKQHGVDISVAKMTTMFGDVVHTRAHMARYLLNKGYTTSINGAFQQYLGDHGPCFVPRENITPYDAVQCILRSGGVPILAHPLLYGMGSASLEQLVAELKKQGLKGIEAIYSSHTPADESNLKLLAKQYDLLISGGSDFHGQSRPGVQLGKGKGNLKIPMHILDQVKEASRGY